MFKHVTISFTVHGFTLVEYSADEDRLIVRGTFSLNRKGSSFFLTNIPGTITSMDITATGEIYIILRVTQCTGLKIGNESSINTQWQNRFMGCYHYSEIVAII